VFPGEDQWCFGGINSLRTGPSPSVSAAVRPHCTGSVAAVRTWYEYREAWSGRPWLLLLGVLAVALVVAGLVGTVLADPLAFLFIPGLAVLYAHHLLVQRELR
jgi:hypothetical protein